MNKFIKQHYIGPDIHGRMIAGQVLHVGKYTKGSTPATYVVALEIPIGGERTAQVSADVLAEHIKGLDLVESIRQDAE